VGQQPARRGRGDSLERAPHRLARELQAQEPAGGAQDVGRVRPSVHVVPQQPDLAAPVEQGVQEQHLGAARD
jgi:hypothetical protein